MPDTPDGLKKWDTFTHVHHGPIVEDGTDEHGNWYQISQCDECGHRWCSSYWDGKAVQIAREAIEKRLREGTLDLSDDK